MLAKQQTQGKGRTLGGLKAVVLGVCLMGIGWAYAPPAQGREVDLQVGVVQRFGENSTDTLTISAVGGNSLTLQFLAGNMEPTTVQTNSVKLELAMQPLAEPRVEEYLVLSDHATFETAEDSAKQWEAQGIQVEITQPGRWQVWAKRDVYRTPLLRRLLLQSLEDRGYTGAHLNTQLLEAVPRATFVVNGFRYTRQQLEITSNQRIRVERSGDARNARVYEGTLRLQPNSYGTYTLVNEVPLETYLRGVVPHEIGANAPYNAVEAQTIIARTYALRNLRRFEADQYQLCADTHCQVYYGLSGTSERSDRAIAATRGQVLTYQNELVDALYSSTTGGVTAPFSDIWNGEERDYLKAVIDSPKQIWDLSEKSLDDEAKFRRFIDLNQGFNETGTPAFRWNRSSSLADLTKDLQRYLTRTNHPLANFNQIQKMEITERSPSGRILTLEVQTDQGVVELHKTEVRSAFTPPRSTLFYLEPNYGPNQTLQGYSFVGGGFGHGVGMSQFGSYNLANLGWSASQILGFYYPNTEIRQLDESIVFYSGR